MAGKTGPNNPGGRKPVDKVRYLRRRLWVAAKQHPGRRFHALYDRIHRSDVLREAWKRVRRNRGSAGVDARRVVLAWGEQGFDFLGCHLRKRLSGVVLEKSGRRLYFLQRWPSQRSMKRVWRRVKELTGRNRNHVRDVRVLIKDLNPVLRGWGNYFRTGNAAKKFNQTDTYVYRRLRTFMVKRRGRNLHAGQSAAWDRNFFWGHGLHRLRGTVQYPEAA